MWSDLEFGTRFAGIGETVIRAVKLTLVFQGGLCQECRSGVVFALKVLTANTD